MRKFNLFEVEERCDNIDEKLDRIRIILETASNKYQSLHTWQRNLRGKINNFKTTPILQGMTVQNFETQRENTISEIYKELWISEYELKICSCMIDSSNLK